MVQTLDQILNERSAILEEALCYLFKGDGAPPEKLVKAICLHQALAESPSYISNLGGLKLNVAKVYDKYGPTLEVVEDEEGGRARICPISQCEIKVPWLAACGHLFEKDIVLNFMKVTQNCPVLGCNKRLKAAPSK